MSAQDTTGALRQLPAGDPARARVKHALLGVAICAALFWVFAVLTTQDKAIRAHSPWQDDPYDVAVSFTMLFVPALVAAGSLRAYACRTTEPIPASRARDLLRCGRLILAAVIGTAAVDWIAVANGAHRPAWGGPGATLIGALTVVTISALAAMLPLHTAGADPRLRAQPGPTDPDWIDDAVTGTLRAAARLGRYATPAQHLIHRVQRSIIDSRWGIRPHRLATATLTALLTGTTVAISQSVSERVTAAAFPAVTAVLALIGTAGTLAFLLAAGSYLRLLRPARATPPSHSTWTVPCFVAAATVPLNVAFRDRISPLIPTAAAFTSPALHLATQICLIAAAAAVLARLTPPALRRIRARR